MLITNAMSKINKHFDLIKSQWTSLLNKESKEKDLFSFSQQLLKESTSANQVSYVAKNS